MKKKILIISSVILAILLVLFFSLKIFLRPKEVARAKVAIVIDDWGYNVRYLNLLKEINAPLTVSVLPNLRYSSKIAEAAQAQGKEVILHLPLEPEMGDRDYLGLEKNTITSAMPEEEVMANFELAISSVPYIQGVSNHMGSQATKDPKLMSIIFSEVKKRGLFFLDNLVTDESVCGQLAAKMKVKFVSRDFFLDNLNDAEYIREQFKKLIDFALAGNQALGVGHAREKTLEVLKEEIPLMQAKGIEFVFASELVK